MMKIMQKIKIIIIKINIKKNAITTNEILIYNRQNTNRGRQRERKKKTYLLPPNYEKTTLSNMQHKHHAH